jgi:nucleotide-binding universal stress UspA family protein
MNSRLRKILVPTDFSELADRALEYGAEIARSTGASLFILHCIPLGDLVRVTASARLPDEAIQNLERDEEAHVRQRVAKIGASHAIQIDSLVCDGPPPATILKVADENGIDLIVMGTQGHTGLRHALMGSVAEDIVRRSSIPVLTVPRGK